MARVLSSPPTPHPARPRLGNEEKPVISCPSCGFSEDRLAKSLSLGCPTCYTTFGPHIATFLPRLHHGTTHIGKRPLLQELAELELRIISLANRVHDLAPGSIESEVLVQLQAEIHARPR